MKKLIVVLIIVFLSHGIIAKQVDFKKLIVGSWCLKENCNLSRIICTEDGRFIFAEFANGKIDMAVMLYSVDDNGFVFFCVPKNKIQAKAYQILFISEMMMVIKGLTKNTKDEVMTFIKKPNLIDY